jgi:UDP-2-acetamido-3-amino-2,3-dideoxy-glucuronate N-acetyltransferase
MFRNLKGLSLRRRFFDEHKLVDLLVFTNVYNPRCEFPRKNEYRKILVKEGATLGANCTVVGNITIGRYAFIGAGAVVNQNVPEFALMVGVPARQIGWMSK